ncbi:permease [[Limnothrix rosea] IAM M-220]|uniref:permease n=1 Tax=[Limnothrix rosea] IAM M-220 TaxID=454133 RepID=UPI00096648B1|nr:permease [[Limnothrix rosea] IAM M-220]OKH15231.1 permease [[Limnothrix rosea] IAM M-220]
MLDANFWSLCSDAALTSLGFFWKALWAFILGYIISGLIQVFVTEDQLQGAMGNAGRSSVVLGTFFGFISSSCSFAALATTKSLFQKGAGFIPTMAFLLASTNLVVELGVIIFIFLGWEFVIGEYLGGVLLIFFVWVLYRIKPLKRLIRNTRNRLQNEQISHHSADKKKQLLYQKMMQLQTWQMVAQKYFMEWGMVWKDVTIGFTVAGIIAVFVPTVFFETLFIGSGQSNPSFFAVLANVIVGPIAAFFTFIGSMGNIPLAAILYNNGVSFGGVMAFIFSDLVVFPVIRVNAKYYGWKMALYILALLFGSLIATSLVLHYSFASLDILPEQVMTRGATGERFQIDYTFFLNIIFLAITSVFFWLKTSADHMSGHHHGERSVVERILFYLAITAYIWLVSGICLYFVA